MKTMIEKRLTHSMKGGGMIYFLVSLVIASIIAFIFIAIYFGMGKGLFSIHLF